MIDRRTYFGCDTWWSKIEAPDRPSVGIFHARLDGCRLPSSRVNGAPTTIIAHNRRPRFLHLDTRVVILQHRERETKSAERRTRLPIAARFSDSMSHKVWREAHPDADLVRRQAVN